MKFIRNCPICNAELEYISKYNRNSAEKKHKICRACAAVERAIKYPSGWSKFNLDVKNGIRKNGFSGKTHSDETRIKIANGDKSYTKTDSFKQKMSMVTRGENNPMFGKSVYDRWVLKYGVEEANAKLINFKNKISSNTKGENNPMFGKPSPIGSGNGWSGWYKGWYFRSILELSYMINVIERFDIKWKSGEHHDFKIQYTDYNGTVRNYYCDFIINDKYLVEIKPRYLINSKSNILKRNAAIKFCENISMVYKITNCRRLTDDEISILIKNGLVILTDRYNKKYNERNKHI